MRKLLISLILLSLARPGHAANQTIAAEMWHAMIHAGSLCSERLCQDRLDDPKDPQMGVAEMDGVDCARNSLAAACSFWISSDTGRRFERKVGGEKAGRLMKAFESYGPTNNVSTPEAKDFGLHGVVFSFHIRGGSCERSKDEDSSVLTYRCSIEDRERGWLAEP